jgi:hypothetical protein
MSEHTHRLPIYMLLTRTGDFVCVRQVPGDRLDICSEKIQCLATLDHAHALLVLCNSELVNTEGLKLLGSGSGTSPLPRSHHIIAMLGEQK